MTFFEDLFDRFHELHSDAIKAVDGLPLEAFDWTPGPGMNSISVLILHLCGSERYWIGDVALGEPSGRDREQEFRARGLNLDQLKQRLAAADEYARQALMRFSPSDLEILKTSPRNDKTFRVGWCLAHALEHTALHVGHLQLTRQLWEQQGCGVSHD